MPASARLFPGIFDLALLLAAVAALACGGNTPQGNEPATPFGVGGYGHAGSYPYAAAHGDACAIAYPHSGGYAHAQPGAYADGYLCADGNSDANACTDGYADTYSYPDANARANGYVHAYPNANTRSNSHADTCSHCNAYAHADRGRAGPRSAGRLVLCDRRPQLGRQHELAKQPPIGKLVRGGYQLQGASCRTGSLRKQFARLDTLGVGRLGRPEGFETTGEPFNW